MIAEILVAVVGGLIVLAVAYLCGRWYSGRRVKRSLTRTVLQISPITMSPGTWKVALAEALTEEEIACLPGMRDGDPEHRATEQVVRSMQPAWDADQTEVTVMVRNVSLAEVTIVEMWALWEFESDQDCKAVVENPPAGDFGVPQIGFLLGAEKRPRAKKPIGYQVGNEGWFGGRQDIALKPDQQVQLRIFGAMAAPGAVRWTVQFEVMAHGELVFASWPSVAGLRTASVASQPTQHLVTGVGSNPDGTLGYGGRDPHFGTT